MNDVYLAGLWTKHLLHELCWQVYEAKRPARPRAPSWSWMALDGPVTFQTDHCEWYTPIVDVISCTVTPVSPSAPFSSVTNGTLVLHGVFGSASPILVRRTQISSEYFEGFGMDSNQQQNPEDQYMGVAQCVATTGVGCPVGRTSTWGVILRPLVVTSIATPVYERVGWFNTPVWHPEERCKITII